MADIRAPFPTTVDGSGVGTVLSKSQAGDTASGKVGSTAFIAKDQSGNIQLITLTAAGAVPVDSGMAGTPVCANSEEPVSGSTGAFQDIATITLTASKMYSSIEAVIACYDDFIGQIVWNDNASETVLGFVFGVPGQATVYYHVKSQFFTSGATGTQELILRGKNLQTVSDLYGTIAAIEAA